MEEGHASHAHGSGHLFETDLTAAHVLHDILFDILHQLLVHDIEHRVVRQGRLFLGLHLSLCDCRGILDVWLDNLRVHEIDGIVFARRTAAFCQSCGSVCIVIGLCSSGHTRVLVLQHTGLCSFNEVVVNLDRTKAENLVEAHDCLLQVEWLGHIVICREGDVLITHVNRGEGLVGKEDELHFL